MNVEWVTYKMLTIPQREGNLFSQFLSQQITSEDNFYCDIIEIVKNLDKGCLKEAVVIVCLLNCENASQIPVYRGNKLQYNCTEIATNSVLRKQIYEKYTCNFTTKRAD